MNDIYISAIRVQLNTLIKVKVTQITEKSEKRCTAFAPKGRTATLGKTSALSPNSSASPLQKPAGTQKSLSRVASPPASLTYAALPSELHPPPSNSEAEAKSCTQCRREAEGGRQPLLSTLLLLL